MGKKDYGHAAGGTVGVGLSISRMINGKSTLIIDRKPEANMDMIKNQEIAKLRKKLADAQAAYARAMERAEQIGKRNGHKIIITAGIRNTREMIQTYTRMIAKWEGRK